MLIQINLMKYLQSKIQKLMSEKKPAWLIALAVFALVSTISLTWFDGNYLIGGGDQMRAIDYASFLKTLDSSWRSELNTGRLEFELMYHTPYSFFYLPLSFLKFGNVATEKIYFYLSLLLPAFFMYSFLSKFFGNKVNLLVRIAASLFYIFNPYGMLLPFAINLPKFSVYLSLPLLAYLMTSIFEENSWNKKVRYGLFFALASMLTSSGFVNVAETAPIFVILSFLIVYEVISHNNKLKHVALILGIFFLSFLLNFWWIYGSFFNIYSDTEQIIAAMSGFKPSGSKVFDSLRLFGFWALNSYNQKVPYFTYGKYYYTQIGVWITYVIPILLILTTAYIAKFAEEINTKFRRKTLLFLLLSFTGVFMVKGHSAPFGFIYELLFNSIPQFRMFREPFSKFGLISVFSYTVVISAALQFASKLTSKYIPKSHMIVSVAFFVYIVIAVYPMFNGEIIYKLTYKNMKGKIVKIPDYWIALSNYGNSNLSDDKILVIPKISYSRKSHIWEQGFDGRPADLLIDRSTTWYAEKPLNKGDVVIKDLYDTIEEITVNSSEKSTNKAMNLIRILNIGNILQMNDFDWLSIPNYENWSDNSLQTFNKNISPYIESSVPFGKLNRKYLLTIPHIAGGEGVYRAGDSASTNDYLENYGDINALILSSVKKEFVLPKIYVPNHIEYYDSQEQFLSLLESEDLISKSPMFLSKSVTVAIEQPNDLNNIEKIEKISDSRYRIFFNEPVSDGLPIVFNESYDEGWVLAKDCNWLLCFELSNSMHFEANFFGNGWSLKTNGKSIDELFIVNSSEFRLKYGLIISISSIIISIIGIVWLSSQKRKKIK